MSTSVISAPLLVLTFLTEGALVQDVAPPDAANEFYLSNFSGLIPLISALSKVLLPTPIFPMQTMFTFLLPPSVANYIEF